MPLYLILLTALGLSFISYTMIDLNLTLLNWQPYLQLQQLLINLGYFNRNINGSIQLVLFLSLFLLYLGIVRSANVFNPTFLKKIIVSMGIVLSLGYTAYSHDLFNYIFDARMITTYGVNPYVHKALDFPDDTWTRFMQWTHRTYPYGPSWLLITVVPSFIGFDIFILNFYLFKLLFLASYLLAAWSVYQIVKHVSKKEELAIKATALFAFNPLVLIDGLLSPHIDMVMAAVGLYGVWCVLRNKVISGGVLILFSVGIKFATLPWLFITNQLFIKRFGEKIFALSLWIISLGMGFAQSFSQSNYQPWYGLLAVATLPILSPYVKMKYLITAGILLSLPMWIYIYHAYTGNWTSAIPIF